MKDIFILESNTNVNRAQSYILSYPYILAYFKEVEKISIGQLVCGAHMVYGWMPTVLDLYTQASTTYLEEGARLLQKAREFGTLDHDELKILASIVNNSIVGVSKLLHFINPDRFAIWDSKIYAFVHMKRAHNYRVADIGNYMAYMDDLFKLRTDPRFAAFHASVNRKIGYNVSDLRAMELVMFLNAPVL